MRAKRLKCRKKTRFNLKWEALQRGIWTFFYFIFLTQEQRHKHCCTALRFHTRTLKKHIWRPRIRTLAIPPPKWLWEREDWAGLNRGSVTDLWARVSAEHWSRAGEAQHNRWITNARTGAPPLHSDVPEQ